MDLMAIRRMLMTMAGGKSMGQIKSGTFTGDGTISVDLNIGFAPDVLVIESDLVESDQFGGGIGFIAFCKGKAVYNMMHADASATTWTDYVTHIAPNTDPYGNDVTSGNYRSKGIYNDQTGVFTVTNRTNNYRVYLVNGTEYRWTAYSKT